ncbi:MAG TPA: DUF4240 domain-containing protein [Gemmatales bacterium]|nr:DUF4240 domain-containing protein [Gemmatales bacterium]
MTHEQFWLLIDSARAACDGDRDVLNEQLEERLLDLDAGEIVAFQRILDELMDVSYRWDLWGVAYIVNGGCSDDGFVYFRGWLISQGRQAFEAALADPDSTLAALYEPDLVGMCENEGFLFVPHQAYESKTGRDLFEDATLDHAHRAHDDEPAGEPWEEDDSELSQRFPKSWAKYSGG